jgi:hypothetical protein
LSPSIEAIVLKITYVFLIKGFVDLLDYTVALMSDTQCWAPGASNENIGRGA